MVRFQRKNDELKKKVKVELLQNLINNANDKGWRHQLFLHLEKKNLLQTPSHLSFEMYNLPPVFPKEVEIESLHRNEKVELEPPAEDEDEQLSSDNRDFNDGEPQKKGIKKKRCTQQKTKKQRRVEVVAILMDSFGKMHEKEKQVARTAKYLAKLFQICLNCDDAHGFFCKVAVALASTLDNVEALSQVVDIHRPRPQTSTAGHRIPQLDRLSWLLAVETNNLKDWKLVPSTCEYYVGHYMLGKQYHRNCEFVSKEAIGYAKGLKLGGDGKDGCLDLSY
ncbi:putative profilin-1-like [Capsicum annuum]|nr:putative profilin-1-like [Capsicum annuum]KAF3680563.1 putative profilin-1-like [Capsicum annuum]